MRPIALALLATASILAAQQNKVVPAGMEFVEGPSVLTYPFGRVDAAIQVLFDADQITLQPGVITSCKLRPSQTSSNYASYTKNYRMTLYQVPVMAATMANDPATNIGTAVGTVVFDGPLTLPNAQALAVQPAPFAIDFPFLVPFPFDGSLGNLLMVLETNDLTTPGATNYPLDAVNLRTANITGLVAAIDTAGCTANNNTMTITGNAATAIVGGTISHTITATNAAGLPFAFAGLGLTRQQVDLGVVGMPGCTSWLGLMTFQLALASGTSYPTVNWNVPNNPIFEGAGVILQAFGTDGNGLGNSVTSNGLAVRVGSSSAPVKKINSSFRGATGTSWFALGNLGLYSPVFQFQGVFP